MGYEPVITGHVESIGHGIGDSNDEAGGLGLPDVEPTFSWVRLAQRTGAHSYRQAAGGR